VRGERFPKKESTDKKEYYKRESSGKSPKKAGSRKRGRLRENLAERNSLSGGNVKAEDQVEPPGGENSFLEKRGSCGVKRRTPTDRR